MIAEIGLMIGMYILVRMVAMDEMRTHSLEKKSLVVTIFMLLTIVVTILVMVSLFIQGTQPTPSLNIPGIQ
jgi:hypothetical protein